MGDTSIFIGEYLHALDAKGRLAVPAKFREAFQAGGVVTRGVDSCLALYTREEWGRLAARIAALPIAQANSRAFSRLMLAGAMEVELDGQGRVVLPEYLRGYARLRKRAVLAGLYSRVEIWDEQQWRQYQQRSERSSSDIAEALASLGV